MEEERDPQMYRYNNDMLESNYTETTAQWLLSKGFKIIWCWRDAQKER